MQGILMPKPLREFIFSRRYLFPYPKAKIVWGNEENHETIFHALEVQYCHQDEVIHGGF